MKVWLDDIRIPNEGWYWVRNVKEAKEILSTHSVTHLSLDHDLGEELTGYDLCKWMAEYNIWPTEFIAIHSANPVGRENMKSVINRYSSFELF